MHYREAAMLALANANAGARARGRRRNFERRRELPDVRVLARAALAARDATALEACAQWLRETGYRDSVTENILGDAARS